MIAAAVLGIAAFTLATAGPYWLDALTRRVAPSLALTAWISSVAAVFVLLAAALVVLLWPDHAPAEGLVELAVSCASSLLHTARPWVGEAAALTSAALAAGAAVRLARSARSQRRARSLVRERHRDLLSIVARAGSGPERVLWLDHPLPLAYSVSGRPGFIVATEGLREHLDHDQQDAVLAHERAHLHGRHHALVAAAETLAAAFPRIPLFGAAPGAIRVLVEHAADRSAAGATSAAAVSSALATVSGAESIRPSWALGLMNETTRDRIRRLDGSITHTTSTAHAAVAVLPVLVVAAAALTLSTFSALLCLVLQS